MRATRRYSPPEISSIGFLSSSAGTGLFIQTGMYSGSITRSSRSLIEESSAMRCARFPEGMRFSATQARAVLGAAPVAAAMSSELRWASSWTKAASLANAGEDTSAIVAHLCNLETRLAVPERSGRWQAATLWCVLLVVVVERQGGAPTGDTAPVELLAVSTGVAIAYGIGLWVVLIIGPATVTVLKGQWPLFDHGWYTLGIVWWIVGFRLARPESWWARHLYGPAKLARAEARYPETLAEEEGIDGEPDPPWVRVASALFLALCAVAAILAVGGLLGR